MEVPIRAASGALYPAAKLSQEATVLKSLDEIAFNPNILALNSAVDASRHSAGIIENIISDAARGMDYVGVAHGGFQKISSTIGSSSEMVSQISLGSQEQVTQNNVANARQTAEAATAMSNQVETTRTYPEELVSIAGLHQT
ncbi:MAG: hypothetical protein NTY38_13955 [Acidobacteria bacterium]|nr:hypothetical protein [Acidobacteriota bacterium]